MKTLKDYDLQRGDWVKFYSSGWREFEGRAHALYCFYDGDYGANSRSRLSAYSKKGKYDKED